MTSGHGSVKGVKFFESQVRARCGPVAGPKEEARSVKNSGPVPTLSGPVPTLVVCTNNKLIHVRTR